MTAGSDPGSTQMPIQPQPQPQPGGSGCQKVMGALTLLMLVAMLVLGFLAWNSFGGLFGGVRERIENVVDSIEEFPQTVADSVKEAIKTETRASVEMEQFILTAIQAKGELVTISKQYAEPNISVSVQDGFLGLCGGTVNHVVEGIVEAGIDLYQIEAIDAEYNPDADSLTLQLPPTQLTSCRIEYIRQYERSFTLCRKDWDEYRLLAESIVLPKMRDEALREGILDEAEADTRLALGSFVRAITGSSDIRIEFRDGPAAEYPTSCKRDLPEGWVFDEESDSWLRQ